MYLSLEETDFQLPCLMISLSGTPTEAARLAPPDLILCNPYFWASSPIHFDSSLTNSRALEQLNFGLQRDKPLLV